MLTKESYQLIDSFLGDCDVESLLRDPNLKELFNKLQKQTYTNSRIKITHGVKLFPQSYFLDKSLASKLYNEKNLRDRGYSEQVALERCAILQNLKCGREYCSKVND